jgi:hypothetical protein
MVRYLFIGVWAILIAIGGVYGGLMWSSNNALNAEDDEFLPGMDYVKTAAITVPIVRDNKVQGYVLAQLVYTVDAHQKKSLPVPLDVFLLDEAFRTIYGSTTIDFEKLEKYDLTEFTGGILKNVNSRFKSKLVHEVLIEQLNFITMDMVRNKLVQRH